MYKKYIQINCSDDLNNLFAGDFLFKILPLGVNYNYIFILKKSSRTSKNYVNIGCIPYQIFPDTASNTFIFCNPKFKEITGFDIVFSAWNETGVSIRKVFEGEEND
jgi:hypothetical protein